MGFIRPAYGITNYTIGKIQVVGNAAVTDAHLIALSGLQQGIRIDPSSPKICASIRTIAQYDPIKSVAIYLTDVDQVSNVATLVIQVEEYPKLANYRVEGLTKKEEKLLLEKVTIASETILSSSFVHKTTASIKKFFLERGFRNVQVSAALLPSSEMAGKATLRLDINKGAKNIVHKIVFEGNQHVDASYLVYRMQTLNEAPRFTLFRDMVKSLASLAPFRKGARLVPNDIDAVKHYFFKHVAVCPSIFTEAKYREAKENILLFYYTQGFRDARITAERLEQTSGGKLTIYLKIEEGKQYRVRQIKWVGNYAYSTETLAKRLNLSEKKVYDPVYIKKRLEPSGSSQTIGDLYCNHGYLFFRAEAVETGIEDDQVDLEIRIYEGRQAVINQVNIVGNTITHDDVIRRELRTLPGDKFNLSLVQDSLRNLTMLKFFKPLSMPKIEPSEMGDKVDLTYDVTEKLNIDLKLSAHSATELAGSLVLGSDNVSIKNLFKGKIPLGSAQHLNLKGEINGKHYRDFSFLFRDPWIWWGQSQYMCALSISSAHKMFPYRKTPVDYLGNLHLFPIGKQYSKGQLQTTVVRIVLGKKLAKYWSVQGSINYGHHRYKQYKWLETCEKTSGVSHDAHLDTLLVYDSTNHPYYPTQGCSCANNLMLTPPYLLLGHKESKKSAIPYVQEYGKYMLDFAYFGRLFGHCVVHISGHSGFLFGLSSDNDLGPCNRFHLGGTSSSGLDGLLKSDFISLRGYPNGSLTPRSYADQLHGGVLFQKLTTEVRLPIMLEPAYVYILGFIDIGDAWLTYAKYNLTTMKKAIGVGLRIFAPIPIIPMLGIDLGYRLDAIRQKSDRTDRLEWHFILNPLSR